jgi:hypothetical protein
MRAFALQTTLDAPSHGAREPQLVLVVGSDMDAGKTTTAARVIYALRAMGHRVAAGKATGVASLADLSAMYDAGASEVLDFAALGEPATIGLSEEEVLSVFHRILRHLRRAAGEGGYVVMELADGIWYRETRLLLESAAVRDAVAHVVFACHSILDAENGLAVLRTLGFGEKVRALSGKLGSSGLLRGVAPDLLGPVPVFDSTDYSTSPEVVATLFG